MSKFEPSSELKLAGSRLAQLPEAPMAMSRQKPLRLTHSIPGRAEEPLILDPIPLEAVGDMNDTQMLQLAQQCFQSSEDYFNATQRTRIMDAMARFRSQHPRGSKYWDESFSRRSKMFRPKTRSMIRKREAAAVQAIFSTSKVTTVKAVSSGDKQAVIDARIQSAMLNARLNEDQRYYLTVAGAIQDADRQGVVIAATEWEYAEATRYFDQIYQDGSRSKHKVQMPYIDRANFRLIAIENFRYSPAADWIDPVNTSPYIIERRPMYVCQIREYARNPKARMKYRDLSDAELMMGTQSEVWDPIRIQREGNKQDRYARYGDITNYSTVWVHRNIVRIEGEDYVYDTVGTNVMLSDVMPLSHLDPRGYRPYVVGGLNIESHNPYPDGGATLMAQLQDEINDNSNLRTDMNKMATAGRMFVKRSAGIDLNALARFAPGAVVEMDDPASVRWDSPKSPPSSNYEENNLLNTEADDLMGNFNQASVAGNRQLGETVGGMQMLENSGNMLTEYDLTTFAKTFVEPLNRQLLDLMRLYETDRDLAAKVGAKLGVTELQYWAALRTPTELTVDVGQGATNPQIQLQKLDLGLGSIAKYFPYLMMMADQSEIAAEIFGTLGYADATRFFPFLDQKAMDDPKYKTLIMQLNQMRMMAFPHIAEAQGRAQQGQAQAQGAIQSAQINAQSKLQLQREQNAFQLHLREMELELAKVELQLEQEGNQLKRDQLMMQREKLANDIAISQETLAMEMQASPLANPHIQATPLAPDISAQIQKLRTPGSGDVATPPVPELFKTAAGQQSAPSADDQPMTGGQFAALAQQV